MSRLIRQILCWSTTVSYLRSCLDSDGCNQRPRVSKGDTFNSSPDIALTDVRACAKSVQAWYDPFGNATGTLATRYGFAGRERDDATGLMYYRARFYDSKLGRFVSEDPIGFRGGQNWYAYTKNNPINYLDPFGLNPTPCDSCPNQSQPKLWGKPQFGPGPYTNSNPFTSIEYGDSVNFWDDPFGSVMSGIYYCYLGAKGFLSDLGPKGTGPFGRSAGGVPGAGEMMNTLELGPDLYNSLDTVDRRNQDYNDAIRCASGNCATSPYSRGNGLGGANNGWPSPPR